jgi:hypothetical protein
MTSLGGRGCRQSQQFLFSYSTFYITKCFGLYRPTGINTQSFLKANTPTKDTFLLLFYINILFFLQIMLCNKLYLKFEVKIADNVLKIAILYKHHVVLKFI